MNARSARNTALWSVLTAVTTVGCQDVGAPQGAQDAGVSIDTGAALDVGSVPRDVGTDRVEAGRPIEAR